MELLWNELHHLVQKARSLKLRPLVRFLPRMNSKHNTSPLKINNTRHVEQAKARDLQLFILVKKTVLSSSITHLHFSYN